MALSMSLQGLHDLEIQEFTGISMCSLKCLQSTYRQNGEVAQEPLAGWPHCLTLMQKQFICDCIEHQLDMALLELKTELCEVCGMEISVQMITCSLVQDGYTMKMVCPSFFLSEGTHH